MSDYQVNTGQVLQIAGKIKEVNSQLIDTLGSSEVKVAGLANTWDSPAAAETITGFSTFVKKYSEIYHTRVNNFVLFLQNSVAQGAVEVEEANRPDGYFS